MINFAIKDENALLNNKSYKCFSKKSSSPTIASLIDVPPTKNYCYLGTYSIFLGSDDEDFGYKIFKNLENNLNKDYELTSKQEADNIFEIQNFLYRHGFAPQAHNIIELNCPMSYLKFGIKMKNIKGKHIVPDEKWIDSLESLCKNNKITRGDINSRTSVRRECKKHNCRLGEDSKPYLIDIDKRWVWKK